MRIGILGAGQLSRMLALAGIPMGLDFVFYTPAEENCVNNLGEIVQGSYLDENALLEFAKNCDVITYENENIPIVAAKLIESIKPLHPNSNALRICQDRLLEKQLFNKLDIPTVPYKPIENSTDLIHFIKEHGFPVIVKSRTQGYDGQKQYRLKNNDELSKILTQSLLNCIVEKMVDFQREVSLIGIRSYYGEIRYYDICENQHKNGILQCTKNRVNDLMFIHAKEAVNRIVQALNFVGCIVVEFFQQDNQLLANEIAPRVHNSGHWTIEGTHCSQFQNHLRAILQLPLGSTQSAGHFKMINYIGELPHIQDVLNKSDGFYHDYKKTPKPGRKLGHFTMRLDE